MGIDISYATDEKTKKYLAANMLLYADRIKENGISGVTGIVNLTKAESEFMDKLKETLVASGVNGLFEDYETSAEIDLTEYDKLDDATQKPKVCGDFIGKEYSDMAVFRADFKESVKNAGSSSGGGSSSSGSSSGGTSSGGSSSSGTSSGGSSSGKGGGSVGAVYYPSDAVVNPSKPETPKKEKILEAYEDIENVSWAWDAILYSYENGIMNGADEKKFMPDDEVKREQLAKIVTLAFGFYDEAAECDFGDVEKSDWAYAYIASAKNNGLMQGTSETKFGYGESVSREDLCLTLYRAALKAGYTFTKTNTEFGDFINVSDYAAEAVSHLAGEGIVNGIGNGRFAPQNTASRAQVAQIIYKIMN